MATLAARINPCPFKESQSRFLHCGPAKTMRDFQDIVSSILKCDCPARLAERIPKTEKTVLHSERAGQDA